MYSTSPDCVLISCKTCQVRLYVDLRKSVLILISYETLNEYGSQVAYQVRFEGNKTNKTRVLFLTEGLLLRQYSTDNMLSMYDVIVVDEVHERHMMGKYSALSLEYSNN